MDVLNISKRILVKTHFLINLNGINLVYKPCIAVQSAAIWPEARMVW